jgi:hypothetical protein
MRIRMRTRSRWAPLAALPFLAGSLSAQETPEAQSITVVGSVTDRSLQRPIPLSGIRFYRSAEEADSTFTVLVAETRSETDGSFRMERVPIGAYRMEVESLGYQPIERRLRVDGASPMEVSIQLVPDALELEGIVAVSLRSRALQANGFYTRREQGLGATFNRDEIEASGYVRVTELLRNARGLTLRRPTPMSNPHLFFRGGGSACRPVIFLDGISVGNDLSVDDLVAANDLEAVEVHRSASLPAQFPQNSCGAILLWTRDPMMGGATRPSSVRRWAVAALFVVGVVLIAR